MKTKKLDDIFLLCFSSHFDSFCFLKFNALLVRCFNISLRKHFYSELYVLSYEIWELILTYLKIHFILLFLLNIFTNKPYSPLHFPHAEFGSKIILTYFIDHTTSEIIAATNKCLNLAFTLLIIFSLLFKIIPCLLLTILTVLLEMQSAILILHDLKNWDRTMQTFMVFFQCCGDNIIYYTFFILEEHKNYSYSFCGRGALVTYLLLIQHINMETAQRWAGLLWSWFETIHSKVSLLQSKAKESCLDCGS